MKTINIIHINFFIIPMINQFLVIKLYYAFFEKDNLVNLFKNDLKNIF